MKTPSHRISIPTILQVNRNNLARLGSFIAQAGFTKITLFFGEGIEALFGEAVTAAIDEGKIQVLQRLNYDDNRIEELLRMAFAIPRNTQAVVGVGGGKVLDVAKYIAYLNELPFISVPTATSNDGFASSGCSLLVEGHRRSVPARIPYGIVVDLDVIGSAPSKLIYSGIGDLVSKITAIEDWEFEAANGKAVLDDFAVMVAKKSVNSVVRMDIQTNIRDIFFLKELVDSLTMSGIAMEIAGNSAPASGSEHLISHALDRFMVKPELHVIQVGVATYLMSIVQNHRSQRVRKFLTETGFFDHVRTLQMKAADFERGIELAPGIKPDRLTCIHLPENRDLARRLLREDEVLRGILV